MELNRITDFAPTLVADAIKQLKESFSQNRHSL
jgi:hypothetical protein